MKVVVCGKGGSGKSTVAAMIAKNLAGRGFNVLVVDMDESNFGLHRQLGVELPEDFVNYFGGRRKTAEKFLSKGGKKDKGEPLRLRVRDIPERFLSRKGNISLLAIGKVHGFGEGCACPMGALARTLLESLELEEGEFVIVDTDAGIEHFGRGVEGGSDLILVVVDPTYESAKLSGKIMEMAESIGKPAYLILNRVNGETAEVVMKLVDGSRVLGVIPESKEIFRAGLLGEELKAQPKEVAEIVDKLIQAAHPTSHQSKQ